MQNKVNTIFSITMLVFFFPAIMGFTLIDHHCTGCHSHHKETAFLLSVHQHDNDSCFCTEIAMEEESHHHSTRHTHDCAVELKKLEVTFTPASFEDWLPSPLEIGFATLFLSDTQLLTDSFSVRLVPHLNTPLRTISGYERLIRNEVFRL